MKETKETTIGTAEIIKRLLLAFLLVGALYFAKKFLIPLAIGGLLATLLLPTCRWLEKKKVSRMLASLACLLLLILAIAIITAVLGWQIAELTNDVAQIKTRATDLLERFQQFVFSDFGISLKEQSKIVESQKNSVTGLIASVAGSLTSILTDLILTLVYVVLLLYYRRHIKNFILQIAPPSQRAETEQIVLSAMRVSQQYLVGLSKMIVCLWIMYGIGFSLLGVRNALFFAVLCGLLEIVPFIGNITGTTLTLLVAAVDGASVSILTGIVITYGAVQFIQGWLLEPIVLGPQVKINPLFTIIALVVGELIWGIPGIVLAIPLMAVVKIVCDHIEPLKPYGFLIGEVKNEKANGREKRKSK